VSVCVPSRVVPAVQVVALTSAGYIHVQAGPVGAHWLHPRPHPPSTTPDNPDPEYISDPRYTLTSGAS